MYLNWLLLHICMLHCIYCCYLIQNKQTPVYAAAFHGHAGALNVLIGAKADVNAADVVRLDIHFTQNDFYVTNNKINLSEQKQTEEALSVTCTCVCISVPTIITLCT